MMEGRWDGMSLVLPRGCLVISICHSFCETADMAHTVGSNQMQRPLLKSMS